jgi:hypothetical protein
VMPVPSESLHAGLSEHCANMSRLPFQRRIEHQDTEDVGVLQAGGGASGSRRGIRWPAALAELALEAVAVR